MITNAEKYYCIWLNISKDKFYKIAGNSKLMSVTTCLNSLDLIIFLDDIFNNNKNDYKIINNCI